MPDKKGKPKTLDDLMSDEEIAEKVKAYDAHMEPASQQHLLNRIIKPAIDEFYTTLKAQLDKTFKSDTAEVRNNLPELRKALIEALTKYFEKALPSALENVKGAKNDEEKLETLARVYDTAILGIPEGSQAPRGVIPMHHYITALTKSPEYEKATVGQILEELTLQQAAHTVQAREATNTAARIKHILPIHSHRLGKYFRPEIEKVHPVESEATYGALPHGHLLEARESVKTGKWPQERPGPVHYGLKAGAKEEKK